MKNFEIKTRSGIVPSIENDVPFEITTKAAEAFIQKRFNAICQKGGLKPMSVSLVSTDTETTGPVYRPFLLLMPIDVLEKKQVKQQKQNNERVSIFNNVPMEHGGVRLLGPIYSLINAYSLTKGDIQSFRSYESKKSTKMNENHINLISQYRTVKVRKEDGVKYAIVIIDPLRLFNDMLRDETNSDKRYMVSVRGIKKLDDLSYTYHVVRKPFHDGKNGKPIKLKKLGGLLK